MNVQLIPTPIHDATSITIDTAAIEAEVQRIASIDYASFVHDIDQLTVALYASHPSACAQYLKCPVGDFRRTAAEKAKELHLTPSKVRPLAASGYFNQQLRALLKVAQEHSDHGAKLVQVFNCFLEHQCEYRLDSSMVGNLQRYLALSGIAKGFIIYEQTDDEIYAVLVPKGGV